MNLISHNRKNPYNDIKKELMMDNKFIQLNNIAEFTIYKQKSVTGESSFIIDNIYELVDEEDMNDWFWIFDKAEYRDGEYVKFGTLKAFKLYNKKDLDELNAQWEEFKKIVKKGDDILK